ncbi:probable RNA polymerase II nuclear localization protein SLC7A6OS [Tetranychus urticae]|uniref:RNA polymerase II nuclear localization protein SLC7A6OS n=1 Tax=Tetranychus urticae TaxID=32264 RepID=T1KQP7_TETUR|nr:probable RNA polymerase II nuclear localization protein SLC7A6OS [Tetranychus urticae]
MSSDCGPRYLRVKRKADEDPCYSSRQYKRCKFIASVKTTQLQDVLKVINNQSIQDSDIIDVNQTVVEEDPQLHEEEEPTFRGYVYDIYCLQDLDNNLYSVDEEDEESDSDSNDENNPRNDYPDEESYDYSEINFYRDWEDEEDYKLRENFDDFTVRGRDVDGSSSEDSLSRNCDDEPEDEDDFDPDKIDVPFTKSLNRA